MLSYVISFSALMIMYKIHFCYFYMSSFLIFVSINHCIAPNITVLLVWALSTASVFSLSVVLTFDDRLFVVCVYSKVSKVFIVILFERKPYLILIRKLISNYEGIHQPCRHTCQQITLELCSSVHVYFQVI